MRLRNFLSTLFILFTFYGSAQNVGINQANPSEKLDVNGNVNITGTIKANGLAGTNGQVLMSTGTGLSWGSAAGYKKCVQLDAAGSFSWMVPAGVTEVMIEAWGGGSGGTSKIGGTSGSYNRTVQTVSAGYNIAGTVGVGSAGGATTSPNGGTTSLTVPTGIITAYGGGAVSATQVGIGNDGTYTAGITNFYTIGGNPGKATQSTFGMRNATTYVEFKNFGAGGSPVGMLNTTPLDGTVFEFENGVLINTTYANISQLPSAGGPASSGAGFAGRPGAVFIWFNN